MSADRSRNGNALVGGRRVAGGANELVRLQEKGVAFRLRLGKIADRDKGRAKHHANQHDPTMGAPVGVMSYEMKRTSLTHIMMGSERNLARD